MVLDYQNESEFAFRSTVYESSLDSNYKKQNGIYYTHIHLAKAILGNLNLNDNNSLIDPCVGVGSFLFAAKQLGFEEVYGVDIDNDAVQKCKTLTGFKNVINMDSIGNPSDDLIKQFGLTSKFDAVVGNPPYVPIGRDFFENMEDYSFIRGVRGSGNNLFVAALYRAFELAKEGGAISYIIPKNFLHVSSYSKLRKMILQEKTIVSIINLGMFFKEVRGEQIVLNLKNSKPDETHIIKLGSFEDGGIHYSTQLKQSEYSDEIILFNQENDKDLYFKLVSRQVSIVG